MATALTEIKDIHSMYAACNRFTRFSPKFQKKMVNCVELLSKEIINKSLPIAYNVQNTASSKYVNIAIKYSSSGVFLFKFNWYPLSKDFKFIRRTELTMQIMYGYSYIDWDTVPLVLETTFYTPEWNLYSNNKWCNMVQYYTPYELSTQHNRLLAQMIYDKIIKNNAELQAYFALNGFPLLSEYKEYFGIVDKE